MPIASDQFIELFITLKQMRYLRMFKKENLLREEFSFDINLLQDFILLSKNDDRYKRFLSCFNFTLHHNIPFCMDLHLGINRATSKHLISVVINDKAYLSRYYANNRIITENQEHYALMEMFIDDFDLYEKDRAGYTKRKTEFDSFLVQEEASNERSIFELQRRITNRFEENK